MLSVANATALIVSFAIIGTIFFIAQYFQEVQGYTVLEGGLRTLPISLGTFVVAPFAGRLAGRIGPRLPVILGAMLAGVAQFLLLRIEPDSSYATLWWDLGLIGIGLVLSPLTAAVLSATPPNRAGLGSSMINTSRQVGISLGTAVLGAFVLQQFSGNIASQFVQRGVPAQASQLPLSGRLPLSPAALHQAINQAFVDALHGSFLISGVGLLAAAVLVAFLLQQKQHATSTRVEAAEAGVLTGASAQS